MGKVETWGTLIDEITYAKGKGVGSGGTLNAHMCLQGGGRSKKVVITYIYTYLIDYTHKLLLTVPLKDITGSSILKLFNIFSIYVFSS